MIKIGEHIYNDEEDVFICRNMIPLSIEILHNETKLPVDSVIWDWSNSNCTFTDPLSYEGIIDSSKISELEYFIEINFETEEEEVKLRNKIIFLDSLNIFGNRNRTMSFISSFIFDENNISNYPFYNEGVPWKFLANNVGDTINALGVRPHVFSQNPLSSLVQDSINYGTSNFLALNYYGAKEEEKLSCYLCGNVDSSLMLIDIYPPKTYYAHLYALCESNDDYENYCVDKDESDPPRSGDHDYDGALASDCLTPVDSLFDCINPGIDSTIDLYMELGKEGYWRDRKDNDVNKQSDVVYIPSANELFGLRLKPGYNVETDSYFCNSRVVTSPNDWNVDANNDGIIDSYFSHCPDSTL